ncbi:MAG: DUF805 domain-containing protein [Methylomonas sp.]
MFCPKCGKENPIGTEFCSACGNPIGPKAVNEPANPGTRGEPMTFGKAISTCLSKYADFNGRAARPEYWWFYLFTLLVSWTALLLDPTQTLYVLFGIAFLLPGLAAGARRLHDTDHSGWWQLLGLTLIGLIPLIFWLASEGDHQANRYGNPV